MSTEIVQEYVSVSINNMNYVKSDTIAIDSSGELQFISLLGYSTIVRAIASFLRDDKSYNLRYNRNYGYISREKYEIKIKKDTDSGYEHLIAYKKDYCNTNYSSEWYTCNMYMNSSNRLEGELFNKLNRYSSIPLLREWMPYIKTKLIENFSLKDLTIKQYKADQSMPSLIGYHLSTNRAEILNIVQEGLKTGALNINGSNKKSTVLEDCRGLDNYLQLFGEGLAKKIQKSFRPKFIPGEDEYDNYLYNIDDYVYYHANVNLYEAQRSVIQSIVNNMCINKNTFLVGEMGSGKSLMSSAACYVHNSDKNKGFNALILCPSHLVNNWKNEVTRFIPNSRSYIIHNLDELLAIKDTLMDPYKVENSFVILSKESAKIGYSDRPAALFKRVGYYKNHRGERVKARNVFVCPECGSVLTKEISVPEYSGSSRKVKRIVPLELSDFAKETKINDICRAQIKVYNHKEERYISKPCGNKLWTAVNKDDESLEWVKLGKSGWYHKASISILMDYFTAEGIHNTKDADLFSALSDQHNSITKTGDVDTKYNGTKKYPVASYIKKRMPRVFDYGIFDEIQNYKGKTEQGHAFHILSQSCTKTINCTGTLMNGYVSSMYYLLYRLFPEAMRREGYKYEDENTFNRVFGVSSTTTESVGYNVRKRSSKLLPGISSLVFTKFLLNNTVFVSLEDMAEGLPNYTEVPYAIEMDTNTASVYEGYETFVRNTILSDNQDNRRYMRQYCRKMLTIPDAPHCIESEYSEDFKVLYAAPTVVEKVTNKDLALLDIVNTKVLNGEKILIYYNDVGTTNLGDHIRLFLNGYGHHSAELKANIKAEKREEHINKLIKAGNDIIICNPSLVETGLNLLDFTTIIFYQVGYNLNTMRQASRRSWRLSQDKDISVYFLYYSNTTQEAALSLMATKLHAALSMEGKFSEEGLRAMSDNQDVLTQIASNVVDGIKDTVDQNLFKSASHIKKEGNQTKTHLRNIDRIAVPMNDKGRRTDVTIFNRNSKPVIDKNLLELFK